MTGIKLKTLAVDYIQNKMAQDDWGSVVYRPPAIFLAWALARMGVSPTAVTTAAFLVVPVIGVTAVNTASPEMGLIAVCCLGILYCVLDCADGPLARALDRSSVFGHYFDLTTDVLYRVVMYGSLGHLADRMSGQSQSRLLVLGLVSAWLSLFARVVWLYRDQLLPPRAAAPQPDIFSKRSFLGSIYAAFAGLDILLPFLALACWWSGALPPFLVWLLIFSAADAIYAQTWALWVLRGK